MLMMLLLSALCCAGFVGWTFSLFLVARTFSSNWKQFDETNDKLSQLSDWARRTNSKRGLARSPRLRGSKYMVQYIQRGISWRVTIRRSCCPSSCKTLFAAAGYFISQFEYRKKSQLIECCDCRCLCHGYCCLDCAATAATEAEAISAKLKINNKHVGRVEENKKER